MSRGDNGQITSDYFDKKPLKKSLTTTVGSGNGGWGSRGSMYASPGTRRYWYDDEDSNEQEITDAVLGVRWSLGKVDLATAYVRRWVTGETPMLWDYYSDREDIYQKLALPVGKGLSFSVRGGYDLARSELAEMVYALNLKAGECSRWELAYRDDRIEGEDWVGLSFSITAFPETPVTFGMRELYDPFAAPDGLADRMRADEAEE